MEKLFSGPFGLLLVIAQAALFFYLLRGMFDAVGEDTPLFKGWRSGRSRGERPSPHPRRPEAEHERPRGWSRVSPIVETFEDLNTGALTGLVVSGLFAGRRLEDLSRSECLRLCEICRDANDDYGMWFMQSYLNRRFAGAAWGSSFAGARRGEEAAKSRRPPPPPFERPDDGPMTRERAYATLGLEIGASEAEIHNAHRAMIKKYHPDHGGTDAQAALINQAKDLLLGR